MAVKMTSFSRKPNGDWFARKGIPSDVRDSYKLAYGKSQEERFRRDASLPAPSAKIAFSDWLAEVEDRIERLRKARNQAVREMTPRQIHALIGRWYEWFTTQRDETHLTGEAVENIYEQYCQVAESGFSSLDLPDDSEEDSERSEIHATRVRAFVAAFSEIDAFMAAEGVNLDAPTRVRLLDSLERDFVAALGVLKRRVHGDYSPDHRLTLFPKAEGEDAYRKARGLAGMTVWEAFEAWVNERQPAPSTVNRWRGVFENLHDFHDKADIALLSDDDAVSWKNSLLNSGRGTRTINEIWLSSVRTVFAWAVSQKKIKVNPFDGLKVAGSARPVKTREPEFTDEEIKTLLQASLAPMSQRINEKLQATYRWVPWLCAYTGARSGEMTQLRKADVIRGNGNAWVINITPEAGTVKGGVYRMVPVHEHLIEQGFLAFVQSSDAGPLFHNGTKAAVIDPMKPPRPAHVIARNKLGEWVRKQGVVDKRISPNHAWRHTFKRRAARAGIEQRLRDALCGHSDGRVGAIYETPSTEDLAGAIALFPRYEI